jgi:hypothetical protein
MFRSMPKRAVIDWLVSLLGPPPPPPRCYFSRQREWYAHHPAVVGRGSPKHHSERRCKPSPRNRRVLSWAVVRPSYWSGR